MTRESKLALIIGFVLVLVVGVLVSDHFSQANTMALDIQQPEGRIVPGPITQLGQREKTGINNAIPNTIENRPVAMQPKSAAPVEIRNGRTAANTGATRPGTGNSILDRAFEQVQGTEFPQAAQLTPRTQSIQRTNPLPEIEYAQHKVVAGDSLIKIARQTLGDAQRWSEIHELNADVLGPDAILKIGVYLKLPVGAKAITTQSNPVRWTSSNRTYTVESGDTLGQISTDLLGTSRRADEIAELNGLESANGIRVGMKLKIPAK